MLHAVLMTVISATEVAGFRMVCCRNPWGNDQEWNGDFSDASKKWDEHPELKQQLQFEPKDDGKFWMGKLRLPCAPTLLFPPALFSPLRPSLPPSSLTILYHSRLEGLHQDVHER